MKPLIITLFTANLCISSIPSCIFAFLCNSFCRLTPGLKRLKLMLYFGQHGLTSGWLSSGSAAGYEFEPLLHVDQHLLEAKEMHNCADQFVDSLLAGTSRLYSVSKDGERIATMELRPHPDNGRVPVINQLRCARNHRAEVEIWQAAYAFLGKGPLGKRPEEESHQTMMNDDLWLRLWAPYWMVKGFDTTLPLQPTERVFAAFDNAIAGLELKADEKDWTLD